MSFVKVSLHSSIERQRNHRQSHLLRIHWADVRLVHAVAVRFCDATVKRTKVTFMSCWWKSVQKFVLVAFFLADHTSDVIFVIGQEFARLNKASIDIFPHDSKVLSATFSVMLSSFYCREQFWLLFPFTTSVVLLFSSYARLELLLLLLSFLLLNLQFLWIASTYMKPITLKYHSFMSLFIVIHSVTNLKYKHFLYLRVQIIFV